VTFKVLASSPSQRGAPWAIGIVHRGWQHNPYPAVYRRPTRFCLVSQAGFAPAIAYVGYRRNATLLRSLASLVLEGHGVNPTALVPDTRTAFRLSY
jgi:hypothetical protein